MVGEMRRIFANGFVDESRKELAVNDKGAPFCVVVGGWFGSYHLVGGFALFFESSNPLTTCQEHGAEINQLRFVTDWSMSRDHNRLVGSSAHVRFCGANHPI